jgi:hypothetical protein
MQTTLDFNNGEFVLTFTNIMGETVVRNTDFEEITGHIELVMPTEGVEFLDGIFESRERHVMVIEGVRKAIRGAA